MAEPVTACSKARLANAVDSLLRPARGDCRAAHTRIQYLFRATRNRVAQLERLEDRHRVERKEGESAAVLEGPDAIAKASD